MSTRKTQDILAALTSKGFVVESKHHKMLWLVVGGKRSAIFTYVSHGRREYHDALLASMARQLKLRRRQLDDLIDCPMTSEAYIKLLEQENHITIRNR